MTDPTGRHPADPAEEAPEPEEHPALPTDVTPSHPLAEIPRPYTREAMDAREQEIKDTILRMGSLVAERIVSAISALERHDADAATWIIEHDNDINAMEREVAKLITLTIVTQQPVARDLRFLLTLMEVAHDLERMGDYAGSVAKQARKLAPHAPLADYVQLPRLGRLAAALVRDVLDAVVEVDAEQAEAVARRDDEVDQLYHAIFAEVLDLMRADPANVDPGMRIIFAAHYLERAGDRVTNIAEDVVYLATGEMAELNE